LGVLELGEGDTETGVQHDELLPVAAHVWGAGVERDDRERRVNDVALQHPVESGFPERVGEVADPLVLGGVGVEVLAGRVDFPLQAFYEVSKVDGHEAPMRG
jgi:hypothetical protein